LIDGFVIPEYSSVASTRVAAIVCTLLRRAGVGVLISLSVLNKKAEAAVLALGALKR
jgi:hypothetical protein